MEYMKGLPQPWIAYKVLAAGAIHPKDGFRYAFENGADFICVGMYDFQIVDDVNIALTVLGDAQADPALDRVAASRSWRDLPGPRPSSPRRPGHRHPRGARGAQLPPRRP